MIPRFTPFLTSALLFSSLGPTGNALASEQWEQDLAAQMLVEYDCEVDFYSNVAQREQEGRMVLFVRVHCHDQRLFDATRFDRSEPFDVKVCEVGQTQSC